MNVATVLFVYHRSKHTEAVLEGLRRNYMLPEKLYIFQDGADGDKPSDEWKKVNSLIEHVDFCPTEIIVSPKKMGLAWSVVHGMNYVFDRGYDAVINLEDDCVPTPNFINYMLQCFERYYNDPRVYSVTGYAWPIDLHAEKSDIYFTGRISSWGWGTWRDRWLLYESDNSILKRIMKNPIKSKFLAKWGADLLPMMMDRLRNKNDSWAIYWALKVIEREGFCISPYVSLIKNIGLDGTGTHSGVCTQYDVPVEHESLKRYLFPSDVRWDDRVQEAYLSLHGSYTEFFKDENKPLAIIYGVGNYFFKNERALNEQYCIDAFIDRTQKGYFAGKRIFHPTEYRHECGKKIIITIESQQECLAVKDFLIEKVNIDKEDVIIWRDLPHNNQV